MKRKGFHRISTCVRRWGAVLLACGLVMTTMTACGDNDENEPRTDDLAYLLKRIANEGSLVYGMRMGTGASEIMNRPVATADEAMDEFYKLLSGGPAHQGLSKAEDGIITCPLIGADGKPQGTIAYRPFRSETVYYCAEVTFSTEVKIASGVSCLRYILYERWPEDGNGPLKDILEGIKK